MNKEDALLILGHNIKKYRLAYGWTQEELAEKCGYTSDGKKSTINKIEHGKSDIPASKLLTFSKVFGVQPADLIAGNADQIRACELFEDCYGTAVFEAVQQFLKLDSSDQAVVVTMMNSLLTADKYKGKNLQPGKKKVM